MFSFLRDIRLRPSVEQVSAGFESCRSYCTVSERCQDGILALQLGITTWVAVQEIRIGTLRLSRVE
jgi:hypothetical protein